MRVEVTSKLKQLSGTTTESLVRGQLRAVTSLTTVVAVIVASVASVTNTAVAALRCCCFDCSLCASLSILCILNVLSDSLLPSCPLPDCLPSARPADTSDIERQVSAVYHDTTTPQSPLHTRCSSSHSISPLAAGKPHSCLSDLHTTKSPTTIQHQPTHPSPSLHYSQECPLL